MSPRGGGGGGGAWACRAHGAVRWRLGRRPTAQCWARLPRSGLLRRPHSPSPAVHLPLRRTDCHGVLCAAHNAGDLLVQEGVHGLGRILLVRITMPQLAVLAAAPGDHSKAVCRCKQRGSWSGRKRPLALGGCAGRVVVGHAAQISIAPMRCPPGPPQPRRASADPAGHVCQGCWQCGTLAHANAARPGGGARASSAAATLTC